MSDTEELTGCPLRFFCEYGDPASRVMVQVLVNEGSEVVLAPALTVSSSRAALRAADYLNLLLIGPSSAGQVTDAEWGNLTGRIPGIDHDQFVTAARQALSGVWPMDRATLPPTGSTRRASKFPAHGNSPMTRIQLQFSVVLDVFDEQRLLDSARAAAWSPGPSLPESLETQAVSWLADKLTSVSFPGVATRSRTLSVRNLESN